MTNPKPDRPPAQFAPEMIVGRTTRRANHATAVPGDPLRNV